MTDRGVLWRVGWQAAVSAGFALLAMRTLDLERVASALRAVEMAWALPALLLFTTAKFVDAWRWRYLLRGVSEAAGGMPPQRELFGTFLVGNAVNNVLPLRAGDVAKVQLLANRYGASRAGVAASLLMTEATLDGAMFVLFLLVAAWFWGVGMLPTVTTGGIAGLAVVAAAGFGVAVVLATRGERMGGALEVVPERWRGRVREQLSRAGQGLYALRSARRAAIALLLSAPAWLIESVMFALMGAAFGLDHGWATYVAAMVAANLAVAVPIAFLNFGPYEALVSGVLIAAGTEQSTALAYALGVHVLTSVWIVVTGTVALLALRVSPAELLRWTRRK